MFVTYGFQHVPDRACIRIGRATSSCNFLSMSHTIFLRFSTSVETEVEKRKKMVWDIDKKLQEDVARPILMHARSGTCWKPYVTNMTIMSNSAYNGYRYEDVWADK